MHVHLTPRESEIRELLLQGLTSTDIAERLGISFETVRVHTKSIFLKHAVHSKAELLAKKLRGEF